MKENLQKLPLEINEIEKLAEYHGIGDCLYKTSVIDFVRAIEEKHGIVYKDKTTYLLLNYPHKNQWFESNNSANHDCIEIVRDSLTNKIKSVKIIG